MAFDLATAQPIGQSQGFNLATAKLVDQEAKIDPSAGGGTLQIGPFDTGIKTPEWLDRGLAGVGKAFSDAGLGIQQRLAKASSDMTLPGTASAGLAGTASGVAGRKLNDLLFSDQDRKDRESKVVDLRNEVAGRRKLDAPLMDTTAGKIGNFGGNVALVAPTVMIPGANTVAGASVVGAVNGLFQPTVNDRETALNVGLGAAGGAGGQYIANKLPGAITSYTANKQAKVAGNQAATAQKFAAAKAASDLGYVIPPADLNPGVATELLSGLSGKIKTAQTASQRNQTVTDTLAKKALGLPEEVPLTIDALNAIRSKAGQAYEAVSGAGNIAPSATYGKALDDAVKPFVSQNASFPGRKVPAVVDDIMSLKTEAFDAGDAIQTIKVLRGEADKAYAANDKLAGAAYKKASEALESAIDKHLVDTNAPAGMLNAYRDARKTIAKTYTVQKALNNETGVVSAPRLAADLAKGKPLSGELLDVAKSATAFPASMQYLRETPKVLSPLDFGAAMITRDPYAFLSLGARPLARNALLSGPVQRAALNPGYSVPMAAKYGPAIANNRLAQSLSAPVGASAGLGSVNFVKQD